ncbi:hypothetical protein PIGHUM_02282 [Pigmentiphaga humi]|uniref:Uncharacterized protein n=1 Tax=Pigmentiphaga humi TaxID=2478468 RepID=A0A3P4B4X6_9BURK|nr:hypothetical protein PIGHUM_02282 [Pigmentiphaga humi]
MTMRARVAVLSAAWAAPALDKAAAAPTEPSASKAPS